VNELLRRHGFRALIVLSVALAIAGIWIRADSGIDSLPGFYALTGIAIVVAVVLGVRMLSRLLVRPEDEYDAD
jgi:MFS-type transporter involved in bile tolerance (Atg22 family)